MVADVRGDEMSKHLTTHKNRWMVLSSPTPSSMGQFLAHRKANRVHGEGATQQPTKADEQTVHRSFAHVLWTAQLFGILPVCGVTSPGPQALHFRLLSARVIYAGASLLTLLAVTLLSSLHTVDALTSGPDGLLKGIGSATAGTVFYGSASTALLLFLRLGRRWPALMLAWHHVECAQRRVGWPRLRLRVRVVAAAILLGALVEHVLSVLVHVPEFLHLPHSYEDGAEGDLTAAAFLRVYSLRSHAFIFSTVQYQTWLGVLVFVASKMATFAWNFTDVFVILVSIALSQRLRQLNRCLTAADKQTLTKEDWREFRECYAMMAGLVRAVDTDISAIILLSFSNNLYFICLQLLNGLSPNLSSGLHYVYFFGSFLFMLARTVGVTLCAAGIPDESKVALPALYNCPGSSFCAETQRLQVQLTADDLALTGLRFFSVTRSFLLAVRVQVTGAVVTYEVVLLQFNQALPPASTTTTPAP